MKFVIPLIFLFLASFNVLGSNKIDSVIPTKKIEGDLIAPFIDSIRLKILSDTILFDTSNLRHFNYLSTNSKPYSPLFIIDFKYEYALDIINGKLVLEFVKEFLNPNNIKSIDDIDPQSSDALFYEYGKLGAIIIFLKKKSKVNYKVAGLQKVYRKRMSTNFDQNPPGRGRWFY